MKAKGRTQGSPLQKIYLIELFCRRVGAGKKNGAWFLIHQFPVWELLRAAATINWWINNKV